MTLDKFGHHIVTHKTRRYINDKISALGKQLSIKDSEINKLQVKFSELKNNLRSVVIINLALEIAPDFYKINNSEKYYFPCSGKILKVQLNNPKEVLNYRIQNEPQRISSLETRNVIQGDFLQVYATQGSQFTPKLFMEILLETEVYHVEN